MSCDAVASLVLMFAASGPVPQAPFQGAYLIRAADVAPLAPPSVAAEPMFADIVARARGLNERVERYRDTLKAQPEAPLPEFSSFKEAVSALSVLNESGSQELLRRGGDLDLKCILHGIAQDLPKRLNQFETATTAADRDRALREMSYLLIDNVEVILAPPVPAV